MKTFSRKPALAFISAGLMMVGATAFAGSTTNCDKVSAEVRAEVEKDPAKVLMVVEDFMVSNETCACEIVKAAILASKANADLIKQIVLTATNVAPPMSKTIVDCASAIAPEHATEISDSSKKVIEDASQPSESTGAPFVGTGVYLVQPSAGTGTVTTTTEKPSPPTKKVVVRRVVVRRSPPDTSTPQSPADADCTCPP